MHSVLNWFKMFYLCQLALLSSPEYAMVGRSGYKLKQINKGITPPPPDMLVLTGSSNLTLKGHLFIMYAWSHLSHPVVGYQGGEPENLHDPGKHPPLPSTRYTGKIYVL